MKTLNEIYQNYIAYDAHGDKGTMHTYIQEYEILLEPYRENPNTSILEIGIYWGYSLKMWREYFVGKVVGADIHIQEPVKELIDNPLYEIIEADATQPEFLNHLNGQSFDIIIDDGSHSLNDQVMSFNLLKNNVRKGGLYIIEDIADIDSTSVIFKNMHQGQCTIIDNRHLKNRFDDVLVVYRF